jgi:uncharacterized protein YjiS (DUF1127 family)
VEVIMSTATNAPAAALGLTDMSRSGRLGAALKKWWAARLVQRREIAAIRELEAMSDHQLKDIGLVRSQIEFAVRGSRDRALPRHF